MNEKKYISSLTLFHCIFLSVFQGDLLEAFSTTNYSLYLCGREPRQSSHHHQPPHPAAQREWPALLLVDRIASVHASSLAHAISVALWQMIPEEALQNCMRLLDTWSEIQKLRMNSAYNDLSLQFVPGLHDAQKHEWNALKPIHIAFDL